MKQGGMSKQALREWLNTRKPDWETIENTLNGRAPAPPRALTNCREQLSAYKQVMNDLSLSRRVNGNALITRYLENLFLKLNEDIHKPSQQLFEQLGYLFQVETPLLMRQLKTSLISALLIFCAGIAAGWFMVDRFPDLASLFASAEMINKVLAGELWTDDLLNIMPSSFLSFSIAANNIAVSLTAFALGALYGVGTLYILGLNGLMLGAVFAFTAHYGMADRLFEFVIAHGVVELSVIIIAGAMGLQLGESLIRPGNRNRLQAFQQSCRNTGIIMLVSVPFLLLAGLIEGYISPNDSYSMATRVIIGVVSGLVFWFIMLFGWPRRHSSSSGQP